MKLQTLSSVNCQNTLKMESSITTSFPAQYTDNLHLFLEFIVNVKLLKIRSKLLKKEA